MKKVQRVVAFDLFGTLLESSYQGPKYYELLEARGFSSEYTAAVIRGQGMNFHPMNWDMSSSRMYGECGPEDEREEYRMMIRKRLGYSFDVPPMAYDALSSGATIDLKPVGTEELVDCWQAENNALKWMPGAKEVVENLKDAQTAVVIISNITAVGEWSVYGLEPLIREFDDLFFSCNCPAVKPDPYMWKQVEMKYGSAEYWMVGDDPLIDLVMPAAMGWKTILVGKGGVSLVEVPEIIRR